MLQAQLAETVDISSRVQLGERFVVRCAYKLADVDSSGKKTKKAARLARGKGALHNDFVALLQAFLSCVCFR